MPRKKLEDYKKDSPEIPSNTCPYLDFLQSIIDEVKDESESQFAKEKLNLACSIIEYVRSSNDSLRQNSYYWYTKFKNIRK